jgi:hypothetical protein
VGGWVGGLGGGGARAWPAMHTSVLGVCRDTCKHQAPHGQLTQPPLSLTDNEAVRLSGGWPQLAGQQDALTWWVGEQGAEWLGESGGGGHGLSEHVYICIGLRALIRRVLVWVHMHMHHGQQASLSGGWAQLAH